MHNDHFNQWIAELEREAASRTSVSQMERPGRVYTPPPVPKEASLLPWLLIVGIVVVLVSAVLYKF